MPVVFAQHLNLDIKVKKQGCKRLLCWGVGGVEADRSDNKKEVKIMADNLAKIYKILALPHSK